MDDDEEVDEEPGRSGIGRTKGRLECVNQVMEDGPVTTSEETLAGLDRETPYGDVFKSDSVESVLAPVVASNREFAAAQSAQPSRKRPLSFLDEMLSSKAQKKKKKKTKDDDQPMCHPAVAVHFETTSLVDPLQNVTDKATENIGGKEPQLTLDNSFINDMIRQPMPREEMVDGGGQKLAEFETSQKKKKRRHNRKKK